MYRGARARDYSGAGDEFIIPAVDRREDRTPRRLAVSRPGAGHHESDAPCAHTGIHEQEFLQPHLQPGALEHTLEVHRTILEAVRKRDGAKAGRLMREHLAQLRQYIIRGAFAHDSEEEEALAHSSRPRGSAWTTSLGKYQGG